MCVYAWTFFSVYFCVTDPASSSDPFYPDTPFLLPPRYSAMLANPGSRTIRELQDIDAQNMKIGCT